MSSNVLNIILNIIASALFFLLGVIWTRMYTRFKMRHLRHLWAPFRQDQAAMVVLSTRPGPHSRSTPRVSLTEMQAFVAITQVLDPLHVHPTAADSDIRVKDITNSNLIVLGGPTANKVAAELWKSLGPKLPFAFDLAKASIQIADREYLPTELPSGAFARDYALLLRVPSPLSSERTVIMCLGCHGFSTFGAARVVTDRFLTKRLLTFVNRRDYFVGVVAFDLEDGNIVKTDFVEFYVLPANLFTAPRSAQRQTI